MIKVYILLILVSALSTSGTLALKTLSRVLVYPSNPVQFMIVNLNIIFNLFFWQCVLSFTAAFLVYAFILRDNELSKVFPIGISMTLLSVLAASVIYGGESFTWQKCVGLIFLLISIYLFSK